MELMQIDTVPRLVARLSAMLFCADFDNELASLPARCHTLEDACRRVIKSEALRKFCLLVLQVLLYSYCYSYGLYSYGLYSDGLYDHGPMQVLSTGPAARQHRERWYLRRPRIGFQDHDAAGTCF